MASKLSHDVISLNTAAMHLEHASQSLQTLLKQKQLKSPMIPENTSLHLGEVPFRIYEASIQYRLCQHGQVPLLDSPPAVVKYMDDIQEKFPTVETFWVIFLDRKNRAIARHLVSQGTLTSSLVHPREIFRPALLASCSAIVVVHNHPSGDPSPSSVDIQTTRILREASKALSIDILDHVVLGRKDVDPRGQGYYSFTEAGLL